MSNKPLMDQKFVSDQARIADEVVYNAKENDKIGEAAMDFGLVLNTMFEELGHAYPAISQPEMIVLIGQGLTLAALVQGAILVSEGVDSSDARVASYKKAVTPDLAKLLATTLRAQGRNVNVEAG